MTLSDLEVISAPRKSPEQLSWKMLHFSAFAHSSFKFIGSYVWVMLCTVIFHQKYCSRLFDVTHVHNAYAIANNRGTLTFWLLSNCRLSRWNFSKLSSVDIVKSKNSNIHTQLLIADRDIPFHPFQQQNIKKDLPKVLCISFNSCALLANINLVTNINQHKLISFFIKFTDLWVRVTAVIEICKLTVHKMVHMQKWQLTTALLCKLVHECVVYEWIQ